MVAQTQIMSSVMNLSIAAENANSFDRGLYIEGSPYKDKEAVEGTFFQKNRPIIVTDTKLNYFRSNFEFVVEGKTYLVDAATIDSIVVNNTTYFYKVFDIYGKKLPRVIEVVGREKNNLVYKFTEVEFKPEVKAGGYVEPKPARYDWLEPVYLFEIAGNLIVLTNFKKLTSTFPEKEKEIKKFIKENRIKKDDPNDLKKLLAYISKL
jgi:hypothetical protein